MGGHYEENPLRREADRDYREALALIVEEGENYLTRLDEDFKNGRISSREYQRAFNIYLGSDCPIGRKMMGAEKSWMEDPRRKAVLV